MRITSSLHALTPRVAQPAPSDPAQVSIASVEAERIPLSRRHPAGPTGPVQADPAGADKGTELGSMLRVRAGEAGDADHDHDGHGRNHDHDDHGHGIRHEARDLVRGFEHDARRALHDFAREHHGEDRHLMRDVKHALRDFRHTVRHAFRDLRHGELDGASFLDSVRSALDELGSALGVTDPAADAPATDAQAAGAPAADAPAGDTPVDATAPAAEVPSVDAPVGDTPAADAPAPSQPAVGDATGADAGSPDDLRVLMQGLTARLDELVARLESLFSAPAEPRAASAYAAAQTDADEVSSGIDVRA